jgi:hypothetical protein
MPRILAIAAFRLLLGCAAAYLFWRVLGPVGLAVSAPVFGVLLAKPIFEFSAELRGFTKALAYADLQGRYFEYRGARFKIVEDEWHHRWIRVKDVRKLVPRLPRDAVLRKQFPDALRDEPTVNGSVIRADALLGYLGQSTEGDSVKFRNWLEREVARPASTIRRRSGVGDAAFAETLPPSQAP